MEKVLDRLLYLGISLALLFSYGAFTGTVAVIAMLIAITISALNGLIKNPRFLIPSLITYTLAVLVLQDFAFFLPLVYLDFNSNQLLPTNTSLSLLSLLSLVITTLSINFQFAILITAIVLGAQVLALRSRQLAKSREELLEQRDHSREMNLLLEAQNKELIAKGDSQMEMARLNERGRIAREIHDHVGHLLSRSILQLGALLVTEEREGSKEILILLQKTLTKAMDQIRLSVHGLYAESLDLKIQLEKLTADFTFCQINLDYRFEESPSQEISNCFLAIIKEGLHNIIRHSNASKAHLTLIEHPALYQVILHDNGTKPSENLRRGLGLQSIADRVTNLNGNFVTSWDNGFRLFIAIPKGGAQFASVSN